ncbi:MAG: bifunctional 5,10-methylenetetrahydrofolate dehydrogenase/5,10-methenyltetrahydrofolate cyclohydrolase [Candidatus Omnitrophica bacterium]|nr:bifunctional 5,10-methylenetetrahydrofolate dehydrogenase/5,10-methenyltetrahydrofolate cyclohydrolase [Candidatus Omnitrophota bacterium]
MPAQLLEGKIIAAEIKEKLKQEIALLGKKPVLASIIVGENAGAESYCKSQAKTAEGLGIEYRLERLSADTTQQGLVDFIKKLNNDASVNGIIIQMPLPKQIDYKSISSFIAPDKDIEGMHPQNLGKVLMGKARIAPCTAAAALALIEATGVNLYGKEVVIVGHSEIVGKPLSLLLLEKFATTTVCHIGTSEAGKLVEHVKNAEILVVAVGRAGLIKGEWIKNGAIVIDVGINRINDKIVGDVEFEEAANRAAYITPVPGGVGPLTVTMLMRNLVEATKLQTK